MNRDHEIGLVKRRMKLYAWMGSLSLVSLFIGLFMGIMILAMKASEVFEGIAPPPSKLFWSQVAFGIFIGLSIALGALVVKGLRNIRRDEVVSK